MLSVDQALNQILADAKCLVDTQNIRLGEANGRVLAQAITAQLSMPPFDQSAMDGYAFKLSELPHSKTLPIKQRIPAGQAPGKHIPGSAARIFTGAPIPAGADCVVIQEDTQTNGENVNLGGNTASWQNIRKQGEEVKQGEPVIEAGIRLDPPLVGICATHGLAQLNVYQRLRVGVMSTGNELLEPGMPLEPGKIYNSSRYLLQGLVEELGFEFVDVGIVGDGFEDTKQAITRATEKCDVLITTGGVSVGEEDYVKNAIDELGAINVWKLAIKPGKPLAFGHAHNTPVFGLPGNPVSSLVTFLILARPYLLIAQGRRYSGEQKLTAAAGFEQKSSNRQTYLRVRLQDNQLYLFNNQSSARLSSAGWADGLAIQAIDQPVTKGDPLEYLSFSALLT
jgi:molybdopterin molybdotransferase